MKNSLFCCLLLVIALSPGLFSCQSSRSHSIVHSTTVKPVIQERLAVLQSIDFSNSSGQKAVYSGIDYLMQVEDLPANTADEMYLGETQSRHLATQRIVEEKIKTLSLSSKSSLQRAQKIIEAHQENRQVGKPIKREARKQERKAVWAVLKEAKATVDDQQTLEVILAFLLAPLGVYLHERKASKPFWISLILWGIGIGLFWTIPFLGLLPAIIYALLVVTDTI